MPWSRMDILQGVATAGYDAFTFYAEPTLTPITLWLGAGTDDTLIDALRAENARVTEPAEWQTEQVTLVQ